MAKGKKDVIPSVFSFERKIDVSDALFYAGKWEDMDNSGQWQPLKVREKSVRGTISHRLGEKTGDTEESVENEMKKSNPQKIDIVSLRHDTDTLMTSFTMRVLGGVGAPFVCNDPDYQQKLSEKVKGYINELGFKVLSERYAMNIANGRFLWRNRVGAEQVFVCVNHIVNGKSVSMWRFNAFDYHLDDFIVDKEVARLGTLIEEGFSGRSHILLKIDAYVRIGMGQEVFPSQEMIINSKDKDAKSKTLYSINEVAAMHSQKIGNAIRTIDTWYDDFVEFPISVEPYGSVTTRGKAYRASKGKHFYSLLDPWVLDGKRLSEEEQHFVVAMIIRGGIFSKTKDKNSEKE